MDLKLAESEASLSKKLKHNEEAMSKELGNSTTLVGSTSASLNSDNLNGFNSDMSYHDDENDGDDAVDDVSDYGDNDEYMFDNDDDDDDDYLTMQAQFDNVDLPPGVEASVDWLKDPAPSNANITAAVSTSAPSHIVSLSAITGTSSSISPALVHDEDKANASSSSTISSEINGDGKKESEQDITLGSFEDFKRFDTVDDFSDHHYKDLGSGSFQPSKAWTKKIQDEWRILEKDLPDTIYVRVYETRMDLLRAVIVGPAGTPYHDGLFVFDVHFPPNYPSIPPMVYYYSGGLRLNPNLYDCGKVCLSLLNTWTGQGNEKWVPKTSTMLQVLVSIQALILNAKPFFNEPGYATTYTGAEGERRSKEYNEDVFILSLKTMMYTLRRPPKYFEEFVAGHFRACAHNILSACKAYMEGAVVGSVINGSVQDADDRSGSSQFRQAVAKMMKGLISNFVRNGAEDCEQFQLPG